MLWLDKQPRTSGLIRNLALTMFVVNHRHRVLGRGEVLRIAQS